MATLKSIKKRVVSVKNTQKITKAMKMVAAAKLRRAHEAVTGSRPYAAKLRDVIVDVSSRAGAAHPLFTPRDEVKNVEVLIFTSNRGLCGGFNSALLRQSLPFIRGLKEKGASVNLVVIGKKGRDFYQARKLPIGENIQRWADHLPFVDALEHTQKLMAKYTGGAIDEFYLVYNSFVSALRQVPTTERLLPIDLGRKAPIGDFVIGKDISGEAIDYIYEPSQAEILNDILPKFMATSVFKAHLESLASELGARMSAMDSATNNASDMIGKLTLTYNRLRQAAITTELMDIVNGAESLK